MNQRGFGKVEVIGFLSIIALCLLIIWLLYNQVVEISSEMSLGSGSTSKAIIKPENKLNPEIDTYQELEEEISFRSKHYFDSNQTDNHQVVTLLKLIQNDYIQQIYSLKKHDILCTGYVEYDRSTDTTHTYLKCDDEYTTEGYQVAKDN